jgi:hypothetical protein
MPRIGIIDDAPMWQPFRQALRARIRRRPEHRV